MAFKSRKGFEHGSYYLLPGEAKAPVKKWIPSLKLIARTKKWMVGIRSFPFGSLPIFRGEPLVLGSVTCRFVSES